MEKQFIGLKVEVILHDDTVVQGEMTNIDSVNRCLFLKNIFFKLTGKRTSEMLIKGSDIKDLNFMSSFNLKKKKKKVSKPFIDPAIIFMSNNMSILSPQESSFSLKKKDTALLSPHCHEKENNMEPNRLKLKNTSNKCTYDAQFMYKKKDSSINAVQKNCSRFKYENNDNWINEDVNRFRDEEFDFQGNLGRFDKHKIFSEIRKSNVISSTLLFPTDNCLHETEMSSDKISSTLTINGKRSSLTESNHFLSRKNNDENKLNNGLTLSDCKLSSGCDKNHVFPQKLRNQHFNGQQSLSSFDKINKKPPKLRNIINNLECPCIKPSKMIEAEYISTFNTGVSDDMIVENAARGISFLVTQLLDNFSDFALKKNNSHIIIILVGNNQTGIYAVFAGRQLCNHGLKVMIVIIEGNPGKQMLAVCEMLGLQSFRGVGGKVISIDELYGTVKSFQIPSKLIIDAIFGCHCSLANIEDNNIKNKIQNLIDWANQYGADILSLDLPSGLDITTGAPIFPSYFMQSKWILSLGLPKTALLFALRLKYATRELFLADIGISQKIWKKLGVGKRIKSLWIGQDWVIKLDFS
ncbi:hypothetical protein PCANB_001780 [Pneumocystis canis]|nr:hypothetical protein PCANB_001780 [Pneumocystis canis]